MLTESQEQITVVDFCKLKKLTFTSIPNGFFTSKRDGKFYGQINKLKKEGYSPGFPDLMIFLPEGNLLIIEMKRAKKGVISIDQQRWLCKLINLGFDANVCNGAEEAIKLIQSRIMLYNKVKK